MTAPRYDAFVVATYKDRETGTEKTRWLRAGVAFRNRDESLTVLLDALPVSGKLQLRLPAEQPDSTAQAEEIPF